MSHYGDYIKEREGYEIFENEHGFASYTFTSPERCYIRDIYVRPESRKKHVATDMADIISALARSRGAKILVGSVSMTANGSTESAKVLLNYGFSLAGTADDLIFFEKDL